MIKEYELERKIFSPIIKKRKRIKIEKNFCSIEEIDSPNLDLSFERIKRKVVSSNNVLHQKLINNLENITHLNSDEISSHIKEKSDKTKQKVFKLTNKRKIRHNSSKNFLNHLNEESK